MKCREFERGWNALFDQMSPSGGKRSGVTARAWNANGPTGPSAVSDLETALVEHAGHCERCSQLGARYQTLLRAMREWGPPPVPSVGLAKRILAEASRPVPTPTLRPEFTWRFPAALAAMTFAGISLSLLLSSLNRRLAHEAQRENLNAKLVAPGINPSERDRRPEPANLIADSRGLNHAVAEATAATWDLARSASEPAARISRRMLDAATEPDRNDNSPASPAQTEPMIATVSVPSLDALTPDPAAAGAMLQDVGGRFATGVRPLSDSARQAFGFLLAPVPAKAAAPNNPQSSRGT